MTGQCAACTHARGAGKLHYVSVLQPQLPLTFLQRQRALVEHHDSPLPEDQPQDPGCHVSNSCHLLQLRLGRSITLRRPADDHHPVVPKGGRRGRKHGAGCYGGGQGEAGSSGRKEAAGPDAVQEGGRGVPARLEEGHVELPYLEERGGRDARQGGA